MKILMTGATGLIGQSLGQKLVELGHEITIVSRSKTKAQQIVPFPCEVIECDLTQTSLNEKDYNGCEAVIHLLGESVDGRWTEEKKSEILNSRKKSTENLLLNLPSSVKTIVTASAQGIYGDRQNEELTEDSSEGSGFLAEVCKAWEKPFHELRLKKEKPRIVIVRIGLVFSSKGGALKKLISLFQKNIGAVLGSGQQWMSWISLNDLVEVFIQSTVNHKFQGVINAVQPQALQNSDFTKLLCQNLKVIQLPSVPSFVLKTLLGEMSEIVLASQKVKPSRLLEWGFSFSDLDLNLFLQIELKPYLNGQGFFYAEQFIAAPIQQVFRFFSEAQNLEKITPKTLSFQIDHMSTKEIQKDTVINYKLKIHSVPARWQTLIAVWNPPYQFVDTQLKGPYTLWYHTHTFKEFAGGTLMIDEVNFKLPLGFLGRITAGSFVESDVQDIFNYRRHIISHQNFSE